MAKIGCKTGGECVSHQKCNFRFKLHVMEINKGHPSLTEAVSKDDCLSNYFYVLETQQENLQYKIDCEIMTLKYGILEFCLNIKS